MAEVEALVSGIGLCRKIQTQM